jgi:hypothetical protein
MTDWKAILATVPLGAGGALRPPMPQAIDRTLRLFKD